MSDLEKRDRVAVDVTHLELSILNKYAEVPILKDVSFQARKGRVLGIAGESGAGKSMTVHAVTGLLSARSIRQRGNITVCGRELLGMSPVQRQQYCASKIALIPQDSIHALNPYARIGSQMYRSAVLWHRCTRKDRKEYLLSRLEQFGVQGGERTLRMYPHQLSGGMRQRIAIAMALESDAEILIADEPTTSLDVMNQFQFLEFLSSVWQQRGLTVIYVSHDLPLLGKICDDMLIMKDGRCVEAGTRNEIFFAPREEYTQLLIREAKRISM